MRSGGVPLLSQSCPRLFTIASGKLRPSDLVRPPYIKMSKRSSKNLFFFFKKPLRLHSLPLTLPKEEKNNQQWLLAVAKATPEAGFTLRGEH